MKKLITRVDRTSFLSPDDPSRSTREPFRNAAPVEEERAQGSLFGEYYRTILRHRKPIFLLALSGLVLSVLANVATLPLYRTRTSLDIQSLNSDFMNMRAIAPTGGGGGGADDINIQTQIKILQSDTLLQNTVARLETGPHADSVQRMDLLSRLERTLHLGGSAGIPYKKLVEDTAKRIKVKPLGMTRLVEVTCDSWSADFSAKFCNTLTREFEDEDMETRSSEAHKTSDWLTRQVADVREKAQESQRALEAATGGNGLILSQESSSVGEDRLRQMQGELVRAQADRMQKEAQLRVATSASVDSLPNVLDNPNYRAGQQKLAELRNSVAELVPPLTEANPKVIHLRSQIREVESSMAAAQTSSTERLQDEYQAAKHREDLLALTYHAQESNVSSDLGKASRVSLLRREVESEQALYQTLLQRAKEAGFASAMQATTIRVVDAADVPRIPFAPQRTNGAIVGLVLGSLCGLGMAFFRERSSKVLRLPGDVEHYVHVRELGVIPSAERNTRMPSLVKVNALRSLRLNPSAEEETSAPETKPMSLKDPSPLMVPPSNALATARWGDMFSIVAEAYRNATFSILLSDLNKQARTYVISSPSASEGKTTVTSNIGVALSKSKLRVVLIDGDLRKPSLHRAFSVANDFGLRNLLRGEADPNTTPLAHFCLPTSFPNLSVLPSGTGDEDVVELLHSPHVGSLLTKLSQNFDVILIDTPPVLHMADARIFAGHADGVILIFRAGETTRDAATDARDLFERDGTRLVGTILNDFDPAREGVTGYYKSYQRYKDHIDADRNMTVAS